MHPTMVYDPALLRLSDDFKKPYTESAAGQLARRMGGTTCGYRHALSAWVWPLNKAQSMDNPEKQSKWDALARELGAAAPPEPVISPRTPAAESGSVAPRRKAAEPPPHLKASSKGWDSLAADLGLEVSPALESPQALVAEMQTDIETSLAPLPSSETASERSGDRPPRRERSSRRPDSSDRGDRSARTPRQPRGESPNRSREDRPRRHREESPRQDHDKPARSERETPSPLPPAPPQEIEAVSAPSLGVSLWHKIFGSPDQQVERIAESTSPERFEQPSDREESTEKRPRGARSGRRGRQHDETRPDSGVEAEVSESWDEESFETALGESTEAESGAIQPADESGEPPRRRRRRGRGRGRGRRSEGESSGEDQTSDQQENRVDGPRAAREPLAPRESRVEREPRGRSRSSRSRRDDSRRQESRKEGFDDGLEEIILDGDNDTDQMDLGIGDEDSAEATNRSTPTGHKSIPSWDDAIGIIVDANLAARTDRRKSSAPQSRGNSGSRGRSRGGRRRNKKE